tara:strand:- start:110 stop:799 length:690 start_codon:yes stop_codon:yes gene_type:complete
MHRVLLIRHGESIWNHSSKFTGWTNIPLTANGRMEGHSIAKALIKNNSIPTVFFSSVLNRAIDTATIIKDSIGSSSPIYTSWRLNEKHYGTLEGIPRDYIREEYGNKFTKLLRTNYYLKPPIIPLNDRLVNTEYPIFQNCYFNTIKNGESKENVLERALPYFENDVLCTLKDGKIPLVVSHKHCIRVLLKHYLKLSDETFDRFNIPSKKIVEIYFDNDYNFMEYRYIDY